MLSVFCNLFSQSKWNNIQKLSFQAARLLHIMWKPWSYEWNTFPWINAKNIQTYTVRIKIHKHSAGYIAWATEITSPVLCDNTSLFKVHTHPFPILSCRVRAFAHVCIILLYVIIRNKNATEPTQKHRSRKETYLIR